MSEDDGKRAVIEGVSWGLAANKEGSAATGEREVLRCVGLRSRISQEYVPNKQFENADVLSRLMDRHEKREKDFELENDIGSLVRNAAILPLAFEDVVRQSRKDPLLKVVSNYLHYEWPKSVEGRDLNYFTIEDCIIFGDRLVIPASQRQHVLEMMHR